MTAANAAALAELGDQPDRQPLALKLAAARARERTPAQRLAQLELRFQLLVSQQQDLPAGHRTLRAAIDYG